MTLQQLEYILAVDKHRHFTKAAEQCFVTQPTLSAMIQKLEDELKVKIFDRNQQPICPTQVGALIIRQACEILSQVEKVKTIIEEERHEVGGKFRLGILPTIAPYLLPRFFQQMIKKYPNLDVTVAEMKTPDIKSALLTGEIDAGILAELSDMDMYNHTHLFYEQFYAYVSRNDGLYGKKVIKTTDLSGELLWLLDEGHCFRDQMVKFCSIKSAHDSRLTYRLGSMETFMRMVEGGKGVTFVPELAVHQMSDAQKELVRPFAIPTPARRIIMLTDKNYIRQTVIDAVQAEIQASVPKDMLALKPSQVAI
ncbi:MAG: LysR family transcriptional regulator [Muribaculaceae bacterium]|nr:LysR family transcriptional regulator [Muribaculaceae bacterium]